MEEEGEVKQSKLQKIVNSGKDIKTENQQRGRLVSESLPTEDLMKVTKDIGLSWIKEEKMEMDKVIPTKVRFAV